MCSAKKVKQVAHIAAAVVNPVGLIATKAAIGLTKGGVSGAQQELVNTAATIAGKNTSPPADPTPTSESTDTSPTEPPALPSPGVSTLAEQRRRKRLASLRLGLIANIRSGGGGDGTTNLLTPTASAGGSGKTLLGQ